MSSHAVRSPTLSIAVIGSGIAGLSAAWLLSSRHRVTLYEANSRCGGHTNTVEVDDAGRRLPIDTGFIVYNERNYPNLVALFEHLGVPTVASDMSFAASLRDGALEYSGTGLGGLLAQPVNLLRPRFLRMLRDLRRFYRDAPGYLDDDTGNLALGELLDRQHYSTAFVADHLVPMASAIWSASAAEILRYPARSFIEFFRNHQLLELGDRTPWRTVQGGARGYVERLQSALGTGVCLAEPVLALERRVADVTVRTTVGERRYDHVVVATHADQALRLLADPTPTERRVLGAFGYARNHAVLHRDPRLMPRRRRAWASWNYLERGAVDVGAPLCMTYWMNRLQPLASTADWFLTLNPPFPPAAELTHYTTTYEHPQFDDAALAAQRTLWSVQGARRTWYCGSYFGYGFHEDALQAGLLVAERLGDVARPWPLPAQPSRVPLPPTAHAEAADVAA